MTYLTPLGQYDMWVKNPTKFNRPTNFEILSFLRTLKMTKYGIEILMRRVNKNESIYSLQKLYTKNFWEMIR